MSLLATVICLQFLLVVTAHISENSLNEQCEQDSAFDHVFSSCDLDLEDETTTNLQYPESCGSDLSDYPDLVQSQPSVAWDPSRLQPGNAGTDNTKYAVVMVDPDAPLHGCGEYWLHWINADIPGDRLNLGDLGTDIVGYEPPTPPATPPRAHRYYVLLYQQPNEIIIENTTRKQFNLDQFVHRNGLELKAGYWYTYQNKSGNT